MKPNKTWIVLADAQSVRIVVNDGPNKGVYGQSAQGLHAPPLSELSDAPGMTYAPAGPNRGGITEPDLKAQATRAFAEKIVEFLDAARAADTFQQFILIAPPAMLGVLRDKLTPALRKVLRADIPKDLTHLPLDQLPAHLGDVLAV